jgi:hypothetical protein
MRQIGRRVTTLQRNADLVAGTPRDLCNDLTLERFSSTPGRALSQWGSSQGRPRPRYHTGQTQRRHPQCQILPRGPTRGRNSHLRSRPNKAANTHPNRRAWNRTRCSAAADSPSGHSLPTGGWERTAARSAVRSCKRRRAAPAIAVGFGRWCRLPGRPGVCLSRVVSRRP